MPDRVPSRARASRWPSSDAYRRLALEFGISDVAIAETCKPHQVPRPPRGHWAKLEHGKHVEQPPLPQEDDKALEVIKVGPGKLRAVEDASDEVIGKLLAVDVPLHADRLDPVLVGPPSILDETEKWQYRDR